MLQFYSTSFRGKCRIPTDTMKGTIQNTLGGRPSQLFTSPFWMEGWALYWEMALWDMGFAQSPEDKVGMQFWRKHRAARIIFSLNYQSGKWTAEQCVKYLIDRVGHEPSAASAEDYRVRLKEKQQRERVSRATSRDTTKYDVLINDQIHEQSSLAITDGGLCRFS